MLWIARGIKRDGARSCSTRLSTILHREDKIFLILTILNKGVFLFLKSFIASILSLPNNIKAHRNFNRFLKEHINLSNDIITFKNLNLLDDYDIIFVGSDQVWSERITQLDPVYLGDFPRKKVKYVSYAASLGSSSYFNDPKQKQLIHYLKNYSKISVREDYLKDWLNEHNIDSKVTLDPSLLADATIYNYIANTTIKKDYVLLIDLHGINSAYNFAQRYHLN